MLIKTFYDKGLVVAFDTDHMTESLPQKGNLLTNYELDLAGMESGALWLKTFYYETSEEYRNATGPGGLPVARRRDGWCFLIADSDDLQRLERVTVDGDTVAARVSGELVYLTSIDHHYEVAEEVNPHIATAHSHLVSSTGTQGNAQASKEACRQLGISELAYKEVARLERIAAKER